MEQNVGGIILLQGGIEPLVDISKVPENKKDIKIISFASEPDNWKYYLN